MKKIALLLGVVAVSTASADVFKCKSSSGGIEYQSTPCTSVNTQQAVVAIKPMTPEQEQQARMKLQAWQEKQEREAIIRSNAEKARQAERDRYAELHAEALKVTAAENQAIAIQQLATQTERNNTSTAYRKENTPVIQHQ